MPFQALLKLTISHGPQVLVLKSFILSNQTHYIVSVSFKLLLKDRLTRRKKKNESASSLCCTSNVRLSTFPKMLYWLRDAQAQTLPLVRTRLISH